jgi:hypothetical protein
VSATSDCQADANVDDASSDSEDPNPIMVQEPAAPYGIGDTLVTLTVTNAKGLVSSCVATVTVEDNEPLDVANIYCGGPGIISTCDAPVLYTPVYQAEGKEAWKKSNGCPIFRPSQGFIRDLKCKFCKPTGKTVCRDCTTTADARTLSIDNSGRAGNFVSFEVSFEDNEGNALSDICTICVEKSQQACNIFDKSRILAKGSKKGSKRSSSSMKGSGSTGVAISRRWKKRWNHKLWHKYRNRWERNRKWDKDGNEIRVKAFSCGNWSIKDTFTCSAK